MKTLTLDLTERERRALIFWTVLCHLATTPKGTLS